MEQVILDHFGFKEGYYDNSGLKNLFGLSQNFHLVPPSELFDYKICLQANGRHCYRSGPNYYDGTTYYITSVCGDEGIYLEINDNGIEIKIGVSRKNQQIGKWTRREFDGRISSEDFFDENGYRVKHITYFKDGSTEVFVG